MAAAALEVVDLRKNYGKVQALDGVGFALRQGEFFGLLGPNGAGKTTLLSIVSGLLDAAGGEVRIDGRPVRRGDKSMRRVIGVVPQEMAIYGELTARENLQFFGELYGLRGAGLRERVKSVLAAVGLEDKSNDRVATFSGGMKRRLNLGAGLVHEPRLLLLDEPTVGVDPQSRNHIFEGVRRLNAAGVTIVYTSHYMEEVQTLCPRVGVIDHGRLVACGEVADLLRTLPGLVRLRVNREAPGLRERLKALPDCDLREPDDAGRTWEVGCRDVKTTLVRVVALLNEMHLDDVGLETEEPNLERVFLHLTGRELRD